MVEIILKDNILIAIIVPRNFKGDGVHFFTPENLSQQLAYICHPGGKLIEPHVHSLVKREVQYTQEVLFIKKGKLRVDIFDDQEKYIKSRILATGDVLFLASGGHGFEVIEEVEMIEVKQGPYAGDSDKRRFKGVDPSHLVVNRNDND